MTRTSRGEESRPSRDVRRPRADRVSVSKESKAEESSKERGGFGSLLAGLRENFQPKDKDEQREARIERRKEVEATGKVLYEHRDFTNGKDDITSRDDYRKIAAGERNEDFGKHLREQHPDWSQEQIDKEVSNLQSHSKKLLDDPSMFSQFDTAQKGGDDDGKISDGDLVAGRLKNDISKDLPPDLSVDEILELHKENPTLGNQAISNKYYHQGQQLNELLGGDDENFQATWPAFGSLASNSAGSVIRSDGVPISDRVSDQVAEGNRKVFADIAPHYDSYLEAAKKPDFDFKEWSKKEGFGDNDRYLQQSFEFLDQARTTDDKDLKQESLLASNVLAGRHEQGRLDPQIDHSTAPLTGGPVERGALEFIIDKDPTFFIPNGKGSGKLDELDVSERIEAPAPAALESISDPGVKRALWESLGHEGNPPDGPIRGQDLINATGTEDWSNLNGRMRTIAGLMVAGQNDTRIGEYVLGYDQPDGLSTTGHVQDLAESYVKKIPLVGSLF